LFSPIVIILSRNLNDNVKEKESSGKMFLKPVNKTLL